MKIFTTLDLDKYSEWIRPEHWDEFISLIPNRMSLVEDISIEEQREVESEMYSAAQQIFEKYGYEDE